MGATKSQDSIETRLQAGRPMFQFPAAATMGILIFVTAPRPSLGPTPAS